MTLQIGKVKANKAPLQIDYTANTTTESAAEKLLKAGRAEFFFQYRRLSRMAETRNEKMKEKMEKSWHDCTRLRHTIGISIASVSGRCLSFSSTHYIERASCYITWSRAYYLTFPRCSCTSRFEVRCASSRKIEVDRKFHRNRKLPVSPRTAGRLTLTSKVPAGIEVARLRFRLNNGFAFFARFIRLHRLQRDYIDVRCRPLGMISRFSSWEEFAMSFGQSGWASAMSWNRFLSKHCCATRTTKYISIHTIYTLDWKHVLEILLSR